MKTIAILPCKCSGTPATDFQDKQYGKGMRVMNSMKTKSPKDPAREVKCTCCSSVHRTEEGKMR